MTDQINANLIVEAVARGFAEVAKGFSHVADSQSKLFDLQKQGTKVTNEQTAADRKLAEQSRAVASAWSIQAQKAAELKARQQALLDIQTKSANVLLGFAAAGGAVIATSTMLAARVETLGVVVDTLGKNMGFTSTEMRGFEKSLTDQGITLQKARQGLALMAQANLDLRESTELATLAQNAAVIAGIDSSEAFQRLVYTISAGNVRMARTMGLQVNFQQAFARTAKETGVATTELDANARANIRLQEVLRAGVNIQGAYDNAMTTAGKKVTSLNRLFEEARRLIGEEYLGAFGRLIDMVTIGLTTFNEMEQMQRSTIVTLNTSVFAWAALTGGLMKALVVVTKLKEAIADAGGVMAILGGSTATIGVLVAAIVALAGAIYLLNKNLDLQVEANNAAEKSAFDLSKSYDDYLRRINLYASQNEKNVATADELAKREAELVRIIDEGAGSRYELMAAEMELKRIREGSFDTVQALSQEQYEYASSITEVVGAERAYQMVQGKSSAQLKEMAENFEFARRHSQQFNDEISTGTDNIDKMALEAKKLDIALSQVAEKSIADFSGGDSDAVKEMIFDLVQAGMEMGEFGDDAHNAAEQVAEAWGLTGDITEQSFEQIIHWLNEAAESGDWELFVQRVQGMATALEELATKGRLDWMQDISDWTGEAAQSMDNFISSMSGKDIGSPIRQFREDLEWFTAGGWQLVQGWQSVIDAFNANVIDEGQLQQYADLFLVASSKMAVDVGDMTKYEAIVQLTKDMTFEYSKQSYEFEKQKAIQEWQEDHGQLLVELKGEELDKANEQIEAMAQVRALMGEAGKYYEDIGDLPDLLAELGNIQIKMDALINAQIQADILQTKLREMSAEQYEIIVNLRQNWLQAQATGGPIRDVRGDLPVYGEGDTDEYQHGANFIVPPGYDDDSYRIGVRSGEHVVVTNPAQMQNQEIHNSFDWNTTVNLDSQIDLDDFVNTVVSKLEERLR